MPDIRNAPAEPQLNHIEYPILFVVKLFTLLAKFSALESAFGPRVDARYMAVAAATIIPPKISTTPRVAIRLFLIPHSKEIMTNNGPIK